MSDLLSLASRGLTGASWNAWIVYFFATTQGTIVAVTLYLHRSQAHRGVQFHPVIAHLFRCWLTTGMVTRQWVAVHRKHHARCETVEDPHSPQVYGIGTVLWGGVDLYKRAAANEDDLATFGAGTPTDWIECHLYEPWSWLGPTLLAAVSIALFGVVGVALWALQMAWIPFWAAGVINGLGHWRGVAQQPSRVSRFSQVLAAAVRIRWRLAGDLSSALVWPGEGAAGCARPQVPRAHPGTRPGNGTSVARAARADPA
jgi:stearoyl-CoA desaturase (delta-9 desaturase)